jgi:hypothetical protein
MRNHEAIFNFKVVEEIFFLNPTLNEVSLRIECGNYHHKNEVEIECLQLSRNTIWKLGQ